MLKKYEYHSNKDSILYLGDSLEILYKIKKQILIGKEKPFDMIFADPPYCLSNGGFTCHAGKAVSVNKGKWDQSKGFKEDHSFNKNWLRLCQDILKDDGTLWVSGTYHAIYSIGFAARELGFKFLNEIAWFKPNASPNLSCRYFTASHETILWLAKGFNSKHTFNYQTMKKMNSDKQMRSVWTIPTPRPSEKTFGKHPTQKPLELMKRIILAGSNEGDIILDPFAGSCTTGVAATELGRKFIGIEKEGEYLEIGIRRLENIFNKYELTF